MQFKNKTDNKTGRPKDVDPYNSNEKYINVKECCTEILYNNTIFDENKSNIGILTDKSEIHIIEQESIMKTTEIINKKY